MILRSPAHTLPKGRRPKIIARELCAQTLRRPLLDKSPFIHGANRACKDRDGSYTKTQ